MPPRLELFSSFRAQYGRISQRVVESRNCPFSTSSSTQASTVKQRHRYQDPYALAQIKARKAANVSRQEVLRRERSKAFGDPIRGVTTPFIESFDNGKSIVSAVPTQLTSEQEGARLGPTASQNKNYLNHFVAGEELEASIAASGRLSLPIRLGPPEVVDPAREDEAAARHEEQHATATEALRRILSIENASSKDRTRINIQRCIEEFGRHNTDHILSAKPPSNVPRGPDAAPLLENTPRAGPDTGSSEVQIAILTAKIRTLVGSLDAHGKKDKMNKRNLRLLVHKRQKLLKYLRRKEKGGDRWQHLIQTLGLTEGTWKGEISL